MKRIHQDEVIRRHVDEKIKLETFLLDRRIKINDVMQNLGINYFDNFVHELLTMGKFLDCALLSARAKNIDALVIDGTNAKLQKDAVYMTLTRGIGGIPVEINGWLKAVRDYVMDRYDNGMKKCYQVLEAI